MEVQSEPIYFFPNWHLRSGRLVHALSGLDGGRAVKTGDRLSLVPTIETSSWVNKKMGAKTCTVIAVNKKHRHFTVKFDFFGHPLRETYKMEE